MNTQHRKHHLSLSSSLNHSCRHRPQNDTHKRQRRQAAGQLVSGLFAPSSASSSASRKSTAQPRPSIRVPPRGIGPVYEPNPNDVLSGRGGRINAHPGNGTLSCVYNVFILARLSHAVSIVQFRDLVAERKRDYLDPATKKLEKAHIAAGVVDQIRRMNPSGRFLKEDANGAWYDIGDAKAIKKVGQALREDAPDIRQELVGSDDELEAPITKPAPPAPPTIVSNRGGKSAGFGAPTYYPSQPYQPVLPGQVPSTVGMRSGGPKKNTFSGAAAAAMEDEFEMPVSRDVAFGRTFHPADSGRDTSMISGLSGPASSAMSGISALTDPMSSLSGTASARGGALPSHALRVSQLQQLRQQWAQAHNVHSSEYSSRMLSPHHAGLGSSMARSHLTETGLSMADASWTDHSLIGGGIPEGRAIDDGASFLSGHYSTNMSIGLASLGTFGTLTSVPRDDMDLGRYSAQRPRQHNQSSAMSIQSGGDHSLPSVSGSIMSDLSENLIALDLAENKLLDHL